MTTQILNVKPQAEKSTTQHLIHYIGKVDGFSVVTQIAHDALELGNEIQRKVGFKPPRQLTQLESDLGTTMGILPLARLPGSSQRLYEAAEDLTKVEGDLDRKQNHFIKRIFESLSDISWASLFISPSHVIKFTAQFMDLGAYVADTPMTYADWCKADLLEKASAGDIKEACRHSKECYLYGLAKNICALASIIFAIGIFVSGVPQVCALVATALSLASAVLGMIRDIKMESGRFEFIDCSVIVLK